MNLYEILQKRIARHTYTNYFSTLCPFHQDTNPSLLVNPDGYYCLGCGAHGSLKKLYNHVFNIKYDYIDRDKSTGKSFLPVKDWLAMYELMRNTGFGVNYLINRGLTQPIIDKLMIGYSKTKGYYSIPIFFSEVKANQDTYGVIFRAHPQHQSRLGWKYWTISNADLYFPFRLSSYADKLVITFGVFDAIILGKMGIPSASTLWGKRMRNETIDYLANLQISVYIIPDRGEEEEAYKIARKLGWRGKVIELTYPYKAKDVNEFYLINSLQLKSQLERFVGRIVEDDIWD